MAWNFGFVAGSTLLQEGHTVADRVSLQGVADASAWITSAFAAGVSGVIVATTSYEALGLIGAFLALAPLAAAARERSLAPATAP